MKNRLPVWFKQDIPGTQALTRMRLLSQLNIHTVCREAKCPNFGDCFQNLRFTFMILGDTCTRNCRFCAVKNSSGTVLAASLPVEDEPSRIVRAVKEFALHYVVITSVTRDDLIDGGAGRFARTIELIRGIDKNIKIEVLIPDFKGDPLSLETVVEAGPQITAHNLETVPRLYSGLRPQADYLRSLKVLARIKSINRNLITKSSLMLGLGEREDEVMQTMEDLRDSQCDILTLGQYLAPSEEHYPVQEFIPLEQFKKYAQLGLASGFKAVLSGPKVRSSYQAEKVYKEVLQYV